MEQQMITVRRNGKRPSCEPCRISKLSCDHVTPVCGRCQRRKIPQKCIFHPAPMTGLKPRVRKQRGPEELGPNPRNSANGSITHTNAYSDAHTTPHIHDHGTRPASPLAASPRIDIHLRGSWNLESSPRDRSVLAPKDSPSIEPVPGNGWPHRLVPEISSRSAITPRSNPTNDWSPAPGLARSSQNPYSGFLGSTSYSAVFDEQHNKIGIDSTDDQIACLSSREHDRKVKEGATVLAQLADFQHLQALVIRWLEHAKGLALVGPFSLATVECIGQELASKHLGRQESLATSEKLLLNSTRPLKVPSMCKMSEYHTLFTGENVRWEALALLFTTAGLSAILLDTSDPLLTFVGQHSSDKQEFVHRMMDLGGSCLNFCTDIGHLNDFGIWVLHEHALLVSQILGDAHYLTWRRFGDLSTAVFAMGLHQDIKDSPDVPFWLTEFRKRCVGVIYGIGQMLAVFLGRPPRMSHRYCSIDYPLDLEFDEIALEGPELAEKLAKINKVTGWNMDGEMRKSSHTRCFVIINRIREDILELSLGRSIEDVSATSADIALRNEQAWNEFPKVLKYYPEIWTGKRSAEDCVTTVIVYLDVVYNEFLLQRTLVRRVRAPSEALVRISRLLLTTVLAVVNNRSQCGTAGCDAAWIVVLYGLPASGVLALELLQQTQNRTQMTKEFPRSEVIQNLSVFVSCLGWIHNEGDGNYHLCIQARNMIQRILDRVLSPESTHSSQQTLPTPSNSDYTDEAMYDFSWMDNAQFDADFWSNLDFHPLLAIPESSI